MNGARDLVPFTYGNVSAVLLNPHETAYDASEVGAIQGTLTLTDLTEIASPNTASVYENIQVTAESLSADGTRHIAVNSAPVRTDGTFTLYPLSTGSSSPTAYDLVIHGSGIATIIIKDVTVNVGDPTTTTPVSIGTVVPTAATSFSVNLTATNPLPAGALVGFYQTLPGSKEVPYLIEERPIDPFSRTFDTPQTISAATLDYGTFVSGSNPALTTVTATEGASTYRVSATAPLFADGVLTTTLAAPSSSGTTAQVAVPTLAPAAGAIANSLTVSITQTKAVGTYNQGELIVSRDGAIVATAALDTLLTSGRQGTILIPGIPGGTAGTPFESALYYVSVRLWNTNNSASTLNREIYPSAADLRTGSITGYTLSID
jgi:hypothetical protein